MLSLVVNEMDIQVVLCVSQDVESDVDVAMGLISSHRLGDVFDFVNVHRKPLLTVYVFVTGRSLRACLLQFPDGFGLVISVSHCCCVDGHRIDSSGCFQSPLDEKSACGRTVSSSVFCFFPEQPCVRS